MEIRLLFLVILILCFWLILSSKGKKLIANFRDNLDRLISGKATVTELEEENDG